MEWIALFIWLLVAALGLPPGRHALNETASLGLEAMAAGGGFVLSAAFVAFEEPPILAWGATAMGVLGLVASAVAALWLVSDRAVASPAGQGAEETDALLEGILLPLFVGATTFSLLAALSVGTVS
ncbi:MAG: hypothetical protein ACXVFN_07940 [Solirubrobacteraceae bacterium]